MASTESASAQLGWKRYLSVSKDAQKTIESTRERMDNRAKEHSRMAKAFQKLVKQMAQSLIERRKTAIGLVDRVKEAARREEKNMKLVFFVNYFRRIPVITGILYYRLRWFVLFASLISLVAWNIWTLRSEILVVSIYLIENFEELLR